MEYFGGKYDVIVIGAGHAGIEAALASARLGVKTAVFTINLDWVGNMPCNPSIGGTSKGHLVREIDALGGEMGKAADKYSLQSRMLNLGKGPAVHSLRAQIDRREYSAGMKHTLELTDNLDIRQGEIVDLYKDGDEWIVKTRLEALFSAKAVIIATGTFLGGRVYIGDVTYESGPDGMFPARHFTNSTFRSADLRRELRAVSTDEALTSTVLKFRRATRLPCRFRLKPTSAPKTRWFATSHIQTKKRSKLFSTISTAHRCTAEKSRAKDLAIVRVLRTKSFDLPTRKGISFSLSLVAKIRKKCTCKV